jgi:hypothetical protein
MFGKKLWHSVKASLRKVNPLDYTAVKKMLANIETASVFLSSAHRDTFCTQIIGLDRVYDIIKYYPFIKEDVEFLEKVLTFRFLENNIHLTERERKVAKEAITQVGDFMRRAYDEKRFHKKDLTE